MLTKTTFKAFTVTTMLYSPKSNKVEVRLEISDFHDISHQELSLQLGIEPSKIFVKGKPYNPNLGRVAPRNRWLINAYKDDCARPIFEEQMDFLIRLIAFQKPRFESICSQYKCEIMCAVTIYLNNGESTPSIHLEDRHISLLKSLYAELDIDIYCSS